MGYRKVARVEQIPPGSTGYFEIDGAPVVVANWGGEFHALAGICPHQKLPLEGATLWDRYLTCPWHNYQFDVASGENWYPRRVFPAALREQIKDLAHYGVEVRGGEIWVDLP